MSKSRTLPYFISAALGVAAFVVGASGANALTNEEIALLTGPNRQATLEEGAKKDGAVVWYCTLREDQGCRPVSAAFEKKYPYVKAQYIATDSASALQRNLVEAQARNVKGDIIQAAVASALDGTNLAQKFSSPETANYEPHLIDPNGNWVAVWEVWNGIVWNTNRMPSANAPQTWQALVDPKYKGLLFWPSALTGAPRMITHFRMMYGEDGAVDFLKKLKANDIRVAPGDAGAQEAGVVSGEYAIILGLPVHQISPHKQKGAPVDGINPEPALARTSAVALIRNAPHPSAAMLFIDFLLSVEGQQALAEAGFAPTRKGSQPIPEYRWFAPSVTGKKEIMLPTQQENAMYEKSTALYNDMFR